MALVPMFLSAEHGRPVHCERRWPSWWYLGQVGPFIATARRRTGWTARVRGHRMVAPGNLILNSAILRKSRPSMNCVLILVIITQKFSPPGPMRRFIRPNIGNRVFVIKSRWYWPSWLGSMSYSIFHKNPNAIFFQTAQFNVFSFFKLSRLYIMCRIDYFTKFIY
jgi:hypothetical protein